MMRVLHVGFGFRPWRSGGLIEYTEDLMGAQVEKGYRVGYFFSGRQYPLSLTPRLRKWTRNGILMYEVINSPIAHGGDRGTLSPELDISEPHSEKLFRQTLEEFSPSVVHVQELAGLPSSLVEIAKELAFPLLMTLEDYFPLCPTLKLFDTRRMTCLRYDVGKDCVACCANARGNEKILRDATLHYELGRITGIIPDPIKTSLKWGRAILLRSKAVTTELTPARPTRSEVSSPSGLEASFQRRKETNLKRLNSADLLIAQSHRLEEIYRLAGVRESRIRTMQLTLKHLEALKPNRFDAVNAPVRFVTLNGCITPQKGAHLLVDALRILRDRSLIEKFRLDVWGGLLDAIREELLSFPNVVYRGWYKVDQLDAMLDQEHVGIIPSTWEEAYGFVGMEFLAKGIPVVGNAMGGIVDYTKEGLTGWLNRSNDANGLAAIMIDLIAGPQKITEMNRAILQNRSQIIKPLAIHCQEMDSLYREAIGDRAGTTRSGIEAES